MNLFSLLCDLFAKPFGGFNSPKGMPRPNKRVHAQPFAGPSRSAQQTRTVPRSPGLRSDTLAIAGFGSNSFVILPPTRISNFTDTQRIRDIPARYFRADPATNLSAGIDRMLAWASDPRSPTSKRAIIFTDGEANRETDRLAGLTTRLRAAHVSVGVVFIGNDSEAALVKKLALSTVGGSFATANDLDTIARRLNAFASPPPRTGNGKRWLNMIAVDGSASMTTMMADGRRRIDAVPLAIDAWLRLHRVNYAQ